MTRSGTLIVAIDGPAGAGKSTVSRRLADRLGLERLDTGAMYRAVAWAVLDAGLDPEDRGNDATVAGLAATLDLRMGDRVTVDGVDVTEAIRGPEVSRAVSNVAANAGVRRVLVAGSASGRPTTGAGWSRAGTWGRWSSPTPTSRST